VEVFMLTCALDHLVVTAPSLVAGSAFIREVLGADMQPGGKHPRMGTHNLLLSLGPSLYLEVIAIDPSAPGPGRPRWFGMDCQPVDAHPAFSTWVARTTDIRAATASCPELLGEVMAMERGDLQWLITVPADGLPPLNGAAPALIEWPVDVHPAARLEDRGLRLLSLEISSPDPLRIQGLLSALNFSGPVKVIACGAAAGTGLCATIDTPQGVRRLSVPNFAASAEDLQETGR
jgi:hypothetical protein